jgi:hypothetical protein
MQDFPHGIMRIVIIAKLGINVSGTNGTIIFFLVKNYLAITFGLTKMFRLYGEFKEAYKKL